MAETRYELVGKVAISRPVSYSFRFKPSGWMIATLNDATGEVSISSDWGNYSYRWHINALGEGETLHSFFARADTDYILDKFSYDNKTDLREVLDEEATRKCLLERITDHKDEGLLSEEQALELTEQVDEWSRSEFSLEDRDACPDELYDFLDGAAYEYIRHEPSARYNFMAKTLLPMLQSFLKETAQKAAAAPGPVPA